MLPNSSQSVYITNSGWKAVAIGANTAHNFPQSMQIQGLHLASPPDTYNVFLMNFSGFQVPLCHAGLYEQWQYTDSPLGTGLDSSIGRKCNRPLSRHPRSKQPLFGKPDAAASVFPVTTVEQLIT